MSGDARRYYAGEGGETREATVRDGVVRMEDSEVEVRVLSGDRVMVGHGGRTAVGFAERRDGRWHVELEGRIWVVRVDDERTHRIRELTAEIAPGGGEVELRAPMPGLVVRVAVAPGDDVRAGERLVVMEAMKMENELKAERDGIVAEVRVAEGTTVDRDAVLVTFEPDGESA